MCRIYLMCALKYGIGLLLLGLSFPGVGQEKEPAGRKAMQLLTTKTCECLTQLAQQGPYDLDQYGQCLTTTYQASESAFLKAADMKPAQMADAELTRRVWSAVAYRLKKSCPAFGQLTLGTSSRPVASKLTLLERSGQRSQARLAKDPLTDGITVDKSVFNRRGLVRLRLHDYYGALTDFQYAVELDSTFAEAISNRAVAKTYLNYSDKALVDANRAIELDSTSSTCYSNRGQVYLYAREYKLADADLRRAIQLNPANGDAYLLMGTLLRYQKNYADSALRYVEKGLQLMPNNPDAWDERGLYWQNVKKMAAAEADFIRSRDVEPTHADAYGNLAELYYQTKRYPLALLNVEKALALKPIYVAYKAKIMLSLNLTEGALEVINDMLSRDFQDDQADLYDQRALIYEKMNNLPAAINDYSTSISLYGADGNAFYKRGLLLLKVKKKPAACADFRQGKALGDADAANALKRYCR